MITADHLPQTSHISLLLLGSFQIIRFTKYHLFFAAGNRAIKPATASIHSARSIAILVPSATNFTEVPANVNKMKENVTKLKKLRTKLLTSIAKCEADYLKAILSIKINIFAFRTTRELNIINIIIT